MFRNRRGCDERQTEKKGHVLIAERFAAAAPFGLDDGKLLVGQRRPVAVMPAHRDRVEPGDVLWSRFRQIVRINFVNHFHAQI